jgi:cytochrome c biogenesis factor
MMMVPILVDFLAMVHGSGEIFPVGQSWFNGRYLIFIAPLLAFGSASLLNSVREIMARKNLLVVIITIAVIAGAYAFTFTSQDFEYGKSI